VKHEKGAAKSHFTSKTNDEAPKYEELQEAVSLLTQAITNNIDTEVVLYGALSRVVDNVTELKQENIALRQMLEEQNSLLQQIANKVGITPQRD
jgi:hypothetical protein